MSAASETISNLKRTFTGACSTLIETMLMDTYKAEDPFRRFYTNLPDSDIEHNKSSFGEAAAAEEEEEEATGAPSTTPSIDHQHQQEVEDLSLFESNSWCYLDDDGTDITTTIIDNEEERPAELSVSQIATPEEDIGQLKNNICECWYATIESFAKPLKKPLKNRQHVEIKYKNDKFNEDFGTSSSSFRSETEASQEIDIFTFEMDQLSVFCIKLLSVCLAINVLFFLKVLLYDLLYCKIYKFQS